MTQETNGSQMKLAKRLAKFINTNDKRSPEIDYWQNKYFSVWEKHHSSIIEVNNGIIVYYNELAEQTLPSLKKFPNTALNKIFNDSHKLTAENRYPFLLELADKKERVLVSMSLRLSETNFFLQIDPEHTDGNPTPIVNLKRATNLLCNSLTDGFITTDLKGAIIYTNQAFKDLTGYTDTEIESKTLSAITPKKWHANDRKILRELEQDKKVVVYDKELVGATGSIYAVEVQAYAYVLDEELLGYWFIIRSSNSYPRSKQEINIQTNEILEKNAELLSINQRLVNEIEEKSRIESRLTQSEDTFRSFIQQSVEGICLFDSTGKIIDWNSAMSDLYEVSREAYLNKPLWQLDFDFLPPSQKTGKEKERIRNAIEEFMKSEGESVFEGEYEKLINNQPKFIQYKVFPIKTEQGKIFGRINLDISERKAAELELEDYKSHLEQLVEERTAELKRSTAHMQLLIESVPMAYYSYAVNERHNTWYSDQIEQLTGCTIEQLKSNPSLWENRINKEDFEIVRGTFDNMLPRQHISCEYRWKKNDGTEIWIFDQAILIEDTETQTQQIVGCFLDITERKRVERAIRESETKYKKSEEKYRLLIETQSDLVVKVDGEGRLLFANPSFCGLFGKKEEELLGEKYLPTSQNEEPILTEAAMKKLAQPPHTCYIEQRISTKNGWRWIAWSDKALLNETGKIKEIIGVGRDITYQKGVEEALKRSEERSRSIVQQLSDVVLILDESSVVVYDTPSIAKVLGYEEGKLIGTKLFDLVPKEDMEYASDMFQKLLNNKNELVTRELRMKHANGRYLAVETIGFNLLEHSSIRGLIFTLRDISDRKQLEKTVLDAVITTEENERERFAKNLHDDLGPLLSSIKLYINSLNTTTDPKKQAYIIEQLNEVIKEAIVTTKDVSNDLSPHILINYGLVSATESFLKKVPADIKVNFTSDTKTERYPNAIENSFYRILKELINNTLKHAGASEINIVISESNQKLHVHYTDNGSGVDMESLKKLRNSGMGLSNIMSRAKSLDGIYEIKTKKGGGFSFKISIPINQGLS